MARNPRFHERLDRSEVIKQLGQATNALVEAALAWGERDYGELGELEADAALNDAIREFKRAVADQPFLSRADSDRA